MNTEPEEVYIVSAARAAGSLLEEVSRSLRFYAQSGFSGGDCSVSGREAIGRWSDPDCLRVKEAAPEKALDPAACDGCGLRQSRKHRIVGTGSLSARLMFIGGYPSFAVDAGNTPYAGEAGRLLTGIISAMGLTPETVYVSHVVKCRPPDGRAPADEETQRCLCFLEGEIKAVAPEVICVLGRFAAGVLLNRDDPLERLRGRFYERGGVRVMPTWHPDDILEDPTRKRPVWEDVKKVMAGLKTAV